MDFNIDNLRYNKVILMSDQDVDGFHIRCLGITMIYRLCPQLIEKGFVYIGETPLYEITYKNKGKEETYFAYTDAERDAIKKGLIRVTAEDAQVMNEYFELFLGSEIAPRKQYIEENGHLYLDDLDLD